MRKTVTPGGRVAHLGTEHTALATHGAWAFVSGLPDAVSVRDLRVLSEASPRLSVATLIYTLRYGCDRELRFCALSNLENILAGVELC